jgi:hypothetical protein
MEGNLTLTTLYEGQVSCVLIWLLELDAGFLGLRALNRRAMQSIYSCI